MNLMKKLIALILIISVTGCTEFYASEDGLLNPSSLNANGTTTNQFGPLIDINQWLSTKPAIASKVAWVYTNHYSNMTEFYQVSDNELIFWQNWSAQQKNDLQQAFAHAYSWYFLDNQLTDTSPIIPVNVSQNANNPFATFPDTAISPAAAWNLYISWLAHTLLLESYSLVPWSIANYDDESQHLLLNASRMMMANSISSGSPIINYYHTTTDNYYYGNGADYRRDIRGWTTISTPIYTYNFLKNANIFNPAQAGTSRKAIENLLQWCRRDNMSHFNGFFTYDNCETHWQYRGAPPVVKIIEGTNNGVSFSHWSAGCHGTSGFLKHTLRALNIPVELTQNCGHSIPVFRTENVFLSHGDDPYSAIGLDNNSLASLDPKGQLVPAKFFQEWFGQSMYSDATFANVGTQPWIYTDQCSNVGIQPRKLTGVVSYNGQPLPNTTVTLTNQVTNVVTTVTTNIKGIFSVTTMPGKYTVNIAKSDCCGSAAPLNILHGNYPGTFYLAAVLPVCVV
jgi:hypothetical protein